MASISTRERAPLVLDEPAIVYVTSLGHAVCHMAELAFSGVMLAVMREFQLEPSHATALALLGYMLMGLGAVPVGIWADAWGPTRVLHVYFLAVALAGVAVACATNTVTLFAALTFLGLATSIYHPTALTMISLGVRYPGRVMGINGVAGSIGVACGPALGMLAASFGMWRFAYLVIAGLALAGGGLMYVACRQARAAQDGSEPVDGLDLTTVGGAESAVLPVASSFWASYGPSMFLLVAMMLGGFNYRCLVSALPTFLSGEQAMGQELRKGAGFVFIALIVGCVGQYVGGSLADRVGGRHVYAVFVSCLAVLAGVLACLEGSLLAVPVACGLAFFLFAQQPVENALLAETTSARRRSTSYGTKFALTFGVGAVGAQATGQIWETYGVLGPVFWLVSASAALMGLMVYGFLVSSAMTAAKTPAAVDHHEGSLPQVHKTDDVTV